MAKKLVRIVLTAVGLATGIGVTELVNRALVLFGLEDIYSILSPWGALSIFGATGLLFAIIFFIFSPVAIQKGAQIIRSIETELSEMALVDVFFAVLGLVVGLVIAFLLSTIIAGISMQWVRVLVNCILYPGLGYLGWSIVIKRRGEIDPPSWLKREKKDRHSKGGMLARPKVLDTSVIIDGRIADVCRTGIIEGVLVVPTFVLQELRHIADSADALKRVRGRRGLDVLNKIQNELDIPVNVLELDYEDIPEVDAKLIKVAYEMGGVVVTNDYNLNKVAGVQRVPVLNINELANAIKPVVIPGEEMHVVIVKDGKEHGQGVAYLDDGTMIVIEGGKRLIGEEADVVVTSALQTAAGRMIFAKIK